MCLLYILYWLTTSTSNNAYTSYSMTYTQLHNYTITHTPLIPSYHTHIGAWWRSRPATTPQVVVWVYKTHTHIPIYPCKTHTKYYVIVFLTYSHIYIQHVSFICHMPYHIYHRGAGCVPKAARFQGTAAHIHTHTHTYTHTYTHTNTHTYTHTYTQTHILTHTHTHIHT
jgi:hypothetical protein